MKDFIKTTILMTLLIGGLYLTYREIGQSYKRGYVEGVNSVNIEDLCVDLEEVGMSRNYKTGYGYDLVRCKVNITYDAKVEDDFIFEGDWDKCDSNGENCVPVAREGL